jgi:excisionase family DNA binding protein
MNLTGSTRRNSSYSASPIHNSTEEKHSMSEPPTNPDFTKLEAAALEPRVSRMSVPEIARRLRIGRLAVYGMLEAGILPGIRVGRRWIITRHAYAQWERTCGTARGAGLNSPQEVSVLN